jgi:hypothetical protein
MCVLNNDMPAHSRILQSHDDVLYVLVDGISGKIPIHFAVVALHVIYLLRRVCVAT